MCIPQAPRRWRRLDRIKRSGHLRDLPPEGLRDVNEEAGSQLPQLLDAKALRDELGVTRAAAEAIMRKLPKVQIESLRKVYVRRSDVAAYLDARTFTNDQLP